MTFNLITIIKKDIYSKEGRERNEGRKSREEESGIAVLDGLGRQEFYSEREHIDWRVVGPNGLACEYEMVVYLASMPSLCCSCPMKVERILISGIK